MINLYPVPKQKPTPKKVKSKRVPWSVDPDKELEEMMSDAMAASGKSRSELLRLCVRNELPAIVARLEEERRVKSVAFAKRFGEQDKPEGKDN